MTYKLTETDSGPAKRRQNLRVYTYESEDLARQHANAVAASWLESAYRECMDFSITIKKKWCETEIITMFENQPFTVTMTIKEEK